MALLSIVAMALLVTVGFHLLLQQSQRVVRSDSSFPSRLSVSISEVGASAAHDPGQSDQQHAITNRSGLHQRLLAMTEEQRNQVFYLIVRDTGAKCIEVISSEYLIAESGVWHAHCAGAQNYAISVDDFGSTSVRPIPYEDVAPGVPPIEPL